MITVYLIHQNSWDHDVKLEHLTSDTVLFLVCSLPQSKEKSESGKWSTITKSNDDLDALIVEEVDSFLNFIVLLILLIFLQRNRYKLLISQLVNLNNIYLKGYFLIVVLVAFVAV